MQRSKTLSDRIICTPEVTMVKFSCLSPGSTVCQIPKPVESRTAYCTVRQNESIMAEVTITNRAGRNNTKADTAGNSQPYTVYAEARSLFTIVH